MGQDEKPQGLTEEKKGLTEEHLKTLMSGGALQATVTDWDGEDYEFRLMMDEFTGELVLCRPSESVEFKPFKGTPYDRLPPFTGWAWAPVEPTGLHLVHPAYLKNPPPGTEVPVMVEPFSEVGKVDSTFTSRIVQPTDANGSPAEALEPVRMAGVPSGPPIVMAPATPETAREVMQALAAPFKALFKVAPTCAPNDHKYRECYLGPCVCGIVDPPRPPVGRRHTLKTSCNDMECNGRCDADECQVRERNSREGTPNRVGAAKRTEHMAECADGTCVCGGIAERRRR